MFFPPQPAKRKNKDKKRSFLIKNLVEEEAKDAGEICLRGESAPNPSGALGF